jgi:hypothetical protein
MAHRVWQFCAEPDGVTWGQNAPISVNALAEIGTALATTQFPGAVAVPAVDETAPMKKSWWETVKERVDEIRTALEFPACPWNNWDLTHPVSRKMLTELRMAVPDRVVTLSALDVYLGGSSGRLSVEREVNGESTSWGWVYRSVQNDVEGSYSLIRRGVAFFESHSKEASSGYAAFWVNVIGIVGEWSPNVDLGLLAGIGTASSEAQVFGAFPGTTLGDFDVNAGTGWYTVPVGVQEGLYNDSRFVVGLSSDSTGGTWGDPKRVLFGQSFGVQQHVVLFLDRLPEP